MYSYDDFARVLYALGCTKDQVDFAWERYNEPPFNGWSMDVFTQYLPMWFDKDRY